MASTNSSEPITETITESNIDEIVETLYNNNDELIGYACKQVLSRNTVEPMDVLFYFDLLTPKATADISPQQEAVGATQEILLREMSREFQIDPFQSRGIRCFDLPVDGSTWIVEMTIETRDFVDITIFGGCRELEWDPETHDCHFYEAHMKGSYIGNYKTDNDGVPFSDAVTKLEEVISGPLAGELSETLGGGGLLGPSNYQTAFLGVPIPSDNPNFQGGKDQGRDVLKEPVNLKTGVESNNNAVSNRKTITVVGGLLVACFSIAFALVGYILYNRRRSYQKDQASSPDLDDHVESSDMHYDIDTGDSQEDSHDDDGHEDHYDEPEHDPDEEYPNLPMSAEAIQMDLGNTLKGQMMGGGYRATNSRLFSPERERGEEHDPDETDSWAQTDGTIGSLELQLEPITAEV